MTKTKKNLDSQLQEVDKNRGEKPTAAQMNQRVNAVYKLIVAGMSRTDILQNGVEKWDVTERTVDSYCALAREKLRLSLQSERDVSLATAIERMTDIFSRTMRVQDYQRAIAAQRELNLLLGLYMPVTVNANVTASVKAYKDFSPDQWDAPNVDTADNS